MNSQRLRRLGELSEEEFNALALSDFATFVQLMFDVVNPGTDLVWAHYLSLICARLQDVAHGQRKRLIITLPPRHLKSFLVSAALPAFVLGHYPHQDIMAVSYAQELSKDLARQSASIMLSDAYRQIFGDVLVGAKQPLHLLRTKQGGVRRATSLDGTATGVGGDLLVFDDPQKPGEALSDTIRRATNSAFENTFASRGNNPESTRIVIVMQRLHEDDFVSHVLGLGGDWEVLNFPAIAEEDEAVRYEDVFGPRLYSRKEGEALHPRRVPLQALAAIRQSMGESGWATQYQQRPAPAGGGVVNTAWFARFDLSNAPVFDRKIQSWDTASTTNGKSDWSVCTTWGVKGKNAYLLHVFRKRLLFPDLKRAVVDLAFQHNASIVLIEEVNSGTSLVQQLKSENFGRVRPIKPRNDKQTRMENQTAAIENGFVFLPREAPWLDDLLHELSVFPNGKHDDQVDSTSQALDHIYTRSASQGWLDLANEYLEKKKQEEYEG